MIVFKKNDMIFCILHNPKCGTHTLFSLDAQIYKTCEVIFCSSLSFGNYDDSNYVHCNLKGAVLYLQRKNINLDKVIFLTCIRNPIKRYISAYFYSLNYSKVKLFDSNSKSVEEDFTNFIYNETHFQNFYPENFRTYQNYKVHTVNLENLHNDLNSFFKIFNISFDYDGLNTVNNKTFRNHDIKLCKEIVDYIETKFHIDYIDGNYEKYENFN
jgi:hypothetical protein